MSRVVAYVGLGSNLPGDLGGPRAQLLAAFEALALLPATRLSARSALYRSAALGRGDQPEFLNAVARLGTALAAEDLLDALQAIERRHGRERPFPDAPRTLDLDLLLYGETIVAGARLTLPHPRMHQRAFVLLPLLELDPQAVVPGHGGAARLLAACAGQRVEADAA